MTYPAASPVESTLVKDWFGPRFAQLHPLLQQLHRHGGCLHGMVDLHIPRGLRGCFGRLIARSMSAPVRSGRYALAVNISHHADGLHWERRFEPGVAMHSVFMPVSSWPHGHCVERTGAVQMRLTVDVIDGGWHWRAIAARWRAMPLPLRLFPRSHAWKAIEGDRYRFHVGISLPLLGTVLSYGGLLDLALPSSRPSPQACA